MNSPDNPSGRPRLNSASAKDFLAVSQGRNVPAIDNSYEPSEQYTEAPTDSQLPEPFSISDGAILGESKTKLDVADEPKMKLEPIADLPEDLNISDHDIRLLHVAHHSDPFSALGVHSVNNPTHGWCVVIRAWIKNAKTIQVRPVPGTFATFADIDKFEPMTKRCDFLFQKGFRVVDSTTNKPYAKNPLEETNIIYELEVSYESDPSEKTYRIRDAYNFGVLLSNYDLKLFQSGSCWQTANLMGSHLVEIDSCSGVRFAVWAPKAKFVSVVGDHNQWDGRVHPMRHRHGFGIWELFIPHLVPGAKYGYKIHSEQGTDFIKIDPFAQEFENPPAYASIVSSCDDAYRAEDQKFQWTDAEWLRRRAEDGRNKTINRRPMAIYEVHLPSWMRGDHSTYLGYRELAHRLVDHCKQMNFTHVEFLPLSHHPFEGSWGYQVSGLYAPYSRLGNADDLKYLIDKLHNAGIGVFVDFVPAHFCKDDWGLRHFDGGPCFEYADPREGEHRGWGTMVYNFRRNEVRSFLLGAAYYWLRRYHIDGLRIDAVSSMLYKNYCREDGDWLPNEFGGDANLQAISLLKEMNWVIHQNFPGVFTMAEEATSWQGVTDEKNLGFDAKWDLGWMNDTLAYLCMPPTDRHLKHSKLTFRGLYFAHEKWILPLSHDEVVSGKGSLLDKCGFSGAPFEERLRTLRALYGFQVGSPGRPLIFMGGEFGQGREWRESRSLDWHEYEEESRKKVSLYVSDLLRVYQESDALHAGDDESWNFQWVECDNAKDCVIAFLRKYKEWHNDVLVVVNFSGVPYWRYPIGVPHGGRWITLINSDDWKYGGGMHGPGSGNPQETTQGGRLGWPYCLWLDIPPFGCLILRVQKEDENAKPKVTDTV